MNYNSTKAQGGSYMPLLMGCTEPSPIESMEDITIIYDPASQKSLMDMRVVGTYSLKVSSTRVKNRNGTFNSKTDRKNEIDDQKVVR